MLSALRNIDKFALRFCQNQFTYEDYKTIKEINTTAPYVPDENSDRSLDDDLGADESDGEERISKLDLDKAYEMYLSKKKEILKSYQALQEQESGNNNLA